MTVSVNRSIAFSAALCLFVSANVHAQSDSPALDVHYVPTPQPVVDRMLAMARVTKDDFVIDLGSGDGRIVITAAQKFGAHGMGVDLDPARIKEANANKQKAGVGDKVEFRQANLFETDLGKATVLTMYLLPRLNIQLRPLLLDLKPGTRLASHAFHMGEWKPDRHERVDGARDAYFWVVPAKVAGRWQIDDGNNKIEIELTQQYQEFQGIARSGDNTILLRETRLDGAEIGFVLEFEPGQPRAFRGRVNGNKIEALPPETGNAAAKSAATWSASRLP
jgi:SAM-dependent methyltransferase